MRRRSISLSWPSWWSSSGHPKKEERFSSLRSTWRLARCTLYKYIQVSGALRMKKDECIHAVARRPYFEAWKVSKKGESGVKEKEREETEKEIIFGETKIREGVHQILELSCYPFILYRGMTVESFKMFLRCITYLPVLMRGVWEMLYSGEYYYYFDVCPFNSISKTSHILLQLEFCKLLNDRYSLFH